MWKNLHRHMKMMPFSVCLTLRWVLEPRFSSIGPRLDSMVRRWRVLCVILWLSMETICFAVFFLFRADVGKSQEFSRNHPENPPRLSQIVFNSPKIPLQMPVKSHLDHLQNDSKTTSSSPQDLTKSSWSPPSSPPCSDPIKPRSSPAHDQLMIRSRPAQDPQNRR